MPNYDYKCPHCGVFEAFQKMSEPSLEECPQCGSPVKRMIGSGSGIIFRGSGFYETDYKTKPKEAKKSAPKNTP